MSVLTENSKTALKELIAYTVPQLYTGEEWYVGFYAYDPALNRMRRKKIKVNFIKKKAERRSYADGLKKRLLYKLERGWNPWIEADNSAAYHTFEEVCVKYKEYVLKLLNKGVYREDTYTTNVSYINNIIAFNNQYKHKITYIYQFDTVFIEALLEHIYIERNNSARTRNNYLNFAVTFSDYLVKHRYLKEKPTAGIDKISKKFIKKERTELTPEDVERVKKYLTEKGNGHYLLACYLLYYCFIRPKEMSKLKIGDISVKKQTIFIADTISKNRTDGVITLPAKIIHLMLELGIFNYPSHYYLFSYNCMPGERWRDPKQFRDYWANHIRKDLQFPKTYQFYSLKDTGIKNMLRQLDKLSVRDQARHSSILTTEIYTVSDLEKANDLIKNHTGLF